MPVCDNRSLELFLSHSPLHYILNVNNHKDGGPRSHEVRAALNALPIVRAFSMAAKMLRRGESEQTTTVGTNEGELSMKSLPPPLFCSKLFCSMVPTCMTSYLPNLGLDLGKAFVTQETAPMEVQKPVLGACHYMHKASISIRNLDSRFEPFGYIDRKYAYRLASPDKEHPNRRDKNEPLDASKTAIDFVLQQNTLNGNELGSLVLCEPPCFIDECSPKRKRPFVNHVTLELDGKPLVSPKGPPAQIEVGGQFCRVIAKSSVGPGQHRLVIATKEDGDVVAPNHVMISHLISFS